MDYYNAVKELTKALPDADPEALRWVMETEIEFECHNRKAEYEDAVVTSYTRISRWIKEAEDGVWEIQLTPEAILRFINGRRPSCTWCVLFGTLRGK